jgi:hypothetical protein
MQAKPPRSELAPDLVDVASADDLVTVLGAVRPGGEAAFRLQPISASHVYRFASGWGVAANATVSISCQGALIDAQGPPSRRVLPGSALYLIDCNIVLPDYDWTFARTLETQRCNVTLVCNVRTHAFQLYAAATQASGPLCATAYVTS